MQIFDRNIQALQQQSDGRYHGLIAFLQGQANRVCSDESESNRELDTAQTFFQQQGHPLTDQIHLILGIGEGSLFEVAYHNSPGRIILFEPDLVHLCDWLRQVDLSVILASPRVWIFSQEMPLIACIQSRLQHRGQLDVLLLPSQRQRLGALLDPLLARLEQMGEDIALDYHSAAHFHEQWLRQFFENLPYLPSASSVYALAGCLSGKPAIVISRGPSLDQALPALRALQQSAVLIAVGGAVRRLWEAGITPDFALFYDANGLKEQRHGIPDAIWANSISVVHPCAQPGCFEAFEGLSPASFFFLTQYNKHMAAWLERSWGEALPLLGGGGTVSVIALRQALLMGCSPIVLIGQDLSFPGQQVYAGGISLQTDALGQMALPRSDTLYAEPEAMTTVLGQNGEPLPALHAFPSFIRQLEQIAAENAQAEQPIPLYNASIGGAVIEGFPCCPLSRFEGEWSAWKDSIQNLLAVLPSQEPQWIEQRRQALQDALNVLNANVTEAEILCDALQKRLKAMLGDPATLQAAIGQFGAFLDRPENDFLAFIPAFELQAFRRCFREVAAQRRQGLAGGADLNSEFLVLLQKSSRLFSETQHHIAVAAERLKTYLVARVQ